MSIILGLTRSLVKEATSIWNGVQNANMKLMFIGPCIM